MSTGTTPAPVASTSGTATSTASRARISRACTTTGNWETRRPSERHREVRWPIRIYAAHQRALEHVISYAEEHVFSSRSGSGGVVQEDIAGVVAAAFDHWESRAGDPQLHTHVVAMNRVQTAGGVWRTLDSRGLFRSIVGLSEMYNGVLSDYLTQSLGWGWEGCGRRHSDVPKYEVTGVPERLREEFSSRTTDIEAAKEVLVAAFAVSHGRQPSAREVLKLRQQATLATRPDKHVRPLADLVQGLARTSPGRARLGPGRLGGNLGRAERPAAA